MYDWRLFFIVGQSEAGVVTQNGTINKGPKQQGLHFKIPFLQKANIIEMKHIRKVCIALPDFANIDASLHWQVKDPIKYFLSYPSGNMNEKINEICIAKLNPILNTLPKEVVLRVARVQKSEPNNTPPELEYPLGELNLQLKDYGVFPYQLIFTQH